MAKSTQYRHYQMNQPTGVSEHGSWSQNTLTIDYFAPDAEIHASITYDEMYRIQHFQYQFSSRNISGDYRIVDRQGIIQRTIDHARFEDTIPLPYPCYLDVPFLSAKSMLFQHISDKPLTVYAPFLTQTERAGNLSKIRIQRQPDRFQWQNTEIDGWRIDYGYTYWLNDDNIVLRAEDTRHNIHIELFE